MDYDHLMERRPIATSTVTNMMQMRRRKMKKKIKMIQLKSCCGHVHIGEITIAVK